MGGKYCMTSEMYLLVVAMAFKKSRFQAEVDFLGQLHHKHLVKLIGYCIEDDQRLLVYEFMARGSLENHLFRSKQSPNMINKLSRLVTTFVSWFASLISPLHFSEQSWIFFVLLGIRNN